VIVPENFDRVSAMGLSVERDHFRERRLRVVSDPSHLSISIGSSGQRRARGLSDPSHLSISIGSSGQRRAGGLQGNIQQAQTVFNQIVSSIPVVQGGRGTIQHKQQMSPISLHLYTDVIRRRIASIVVNQIAVAAVYRCRPAQNRVFQWTNRQTAQNWRTRMPRTGTAIAINEREGVSILSRSSKITDETPRMVSAAICVCDKARQRLFRF